jgi:spore coat polysaccharide biosynthesis predicted glycosyltransferase SpsG
MTVLPGADPGAGSLWIRTAAGPDIGFGHLKRSLVLAELLSDCLTPLFLLDPQDFGSRDLIAAADQQFLAMHINAAWDLLPDPAALLIDTRETRELNTLISRAEEKCIPVISIHDLGLNPLPSNVVIDGSIAPVEVADSRSLLYRGAEYMVLHPFYRMFHEKQKQIGKSIRSVFVNLGGGNSGRFFPPIMEGLRLCGREFDITGVRGFSSWGQDSFGARDWSPMRFRWESWSPEAALFNADLAITAGGISAYEALCTGTPLLALSYDCWQQKTVSALARKGGCIDLGLGGELIPDRLADLLTVIDGNEDMRRRLSCRGKEIVDGRGAERVAQIIRRTVFNRTPKCLGARRW